MDRRTLLVSGLTAAVAGCLGGGDSGGSGGGGNDLSSHPATQALDAQPSLGPDPREATGLIVAFEDPSCPRCKAFEQQVVPKIRSNLVDPGKAAFVFRGYPVVYSWGEPATRALEATYDRSEDAFWSLAAHFFEEQRTFQRASDTEVYDRSATFLSEQTSLDGDAVMEGAANGEYDDAVQTDLDAGMAADAGRTTPHVFLFRDGTFRTKVAGSASYDQIAATLNL